MARRRKRSSRTNPAPVILVRGRRRNIQGFVDKKGKFGPKGRFHPIRESKGYDPAEAGESGRRRRTKKRATKRRTKAKRGRRR